MYGPAVRCKRFVDLVVIPRDAANVNVLSVVFSTSDGDEAERDVSQAGIRPSVRRPR
jgi:hypothetical protein